jgi:cold shock protein
MWLILLRSDRYRRTRWKFNALSGLTPIWCNGFSDTTLATRVWRYRCAHFLFRERNTEMPTGTVKFFNADKGYGFIAPDGGGEDSFVHITAVQAAGMATLDKEQRLNYEVEEGRNGKKSAVNLSAAD